MSEPKLISPMLDGFAIGGPIAEHHGVSCYPAMENESDDKYIVKIVSIPASQTQMDALLLTGAFSDTASALSYFRDLADGVVEEAEILKRLSQLEGFIPYERWQIAPKEDGTGFDVYLLGNYKRTLQKQFTRHPLTHLGALNLGLDLCAALAICRRSGYLYVALKPNNVFVIENQSFRIGDLGFIPLDSLQYASLPDKYRSPYTPPEISDAFSQLNTTIDIYAVGLILYQAYNNGELPFTSESAPNEVLPPPAYADYEMAEIILKACSPDPAERWQNPMDLGQALVSYMQRNGANDTPIVPPVPVSQEELLQDALDADETIEEKENVPDEVQSAESAGSDLVPLEAHTEDIEGILLDVIQPDDVVQSQEDESSSAPEELADPQETSVFFEEEESINEDDFENLSFLTDDDLLDYHELEGISYDELSGELSEMLEQADALTAHPVPAPVVAPEPIEVPMPDPVIPEEDPEPESEEADEDVSELAMSPVEPESAEEAAPELEDDSEVPAPKRHWLRNTLIIVIILGLLAAGAYFFRNYYLISIDNIEVSGSEDSLTVMVSTQIDESILTVICTDSHGNQLSEPLVDGKATFTGLVPDTAYTVKVAVKGFHKITGDSSTAYSTPMQTNIIQLNAITGSEDGSLILGFTVDGPDSEYWKVIYSAEGEEEKAVTFPSHMVTLTGLTVGKEYTIRVEPESDLYIAGNDVLTHTVSKLIYAENLSIDSCMNNALTASWSIPEGCNVNSWTVHCYNGDDYNETISTTETTVTFENLDHADSFTVEVVAEGMSVGARVFVEENSVTVYNVQLDDTDLSRLIITWDSSRTLESGWLLQYTVDGLGSYDVLCDTNTATISPVVPGATYQIMLQPFDGSAAINAKYLIQLRSAEAFNCNYTDSPVTDVDMVFEMCKTPPYDNWNRYYLASSDYTTSFQIGNKASFLVKLTKSYGISDDVITTMFHIKDSNGNTVSFDTIQSTWSDMWYRNYGEFDIPALPATAGDYTVDVYFNGMLAHSQAFSMTE